MYSFFILRMNDFPLKQDSYESNITHCLEIMKHEGDILPSHSNNTSWGSDKKYVQCIKKLKLKVTSCTSQKTWVRRQQTYRQVFQRWWHHQLGGGHTWGPSDWRVWQGEVGGAVLGSCTTWSQDWHAGMLPCTAGLVLCKMSSAGLGGQPTTHLGSSSPDGSLSEGIFLVPVTVF